MRSKKLVLIFGVAVLLVGAAAFIAGRMLSQGVEPIGLGMPLQGDGDFVSVSIQVTPAPELPITKSEVTGLFLERQDNSIVISPISMEAGGGGVALESVESGGGEVQSLSDLPDSGPKVEVVVTGETVIYLETTQFSGPPSGGNQVIQQTVAEGSIDDLSSDSFVTVWGRRSGDRIIADVVFITNPIMISRP
jgi:hypothetical protein